MGCQLKFAANPKSLYFKQKVLYAKSTPGYLNTYAEFIRVLEEDAKGFMRLALGIFYLQAGFKDYSYFQFKRSCQQKNPFAGVYLNIFCKTVEIDSFIQKAADLGGVFDLCCLSVSEMLRAFLLKSINA